MEVNGLLFLEYQGVARRLPQGQRARRKGSSDELGQKLYWKIFSARVHYRGRERGGERARAMTNGISYIHFGFSATLGPHHHHHSDKNRPEFYIAYTVLNVA